MDAAQASGVVRLLFFGSSCIHPEFAEQPIEKPNLREARWNPPVTPTSRQIAGSTAPAGPRPCPPSCTRPGDNFHTENSHVLPALIRRFHATDEEDRDEVVLRAEARLG